jgi:hypothetical protein
MSSADDFVNKLDAYIDMRIREHKPGTRAAEVTRDSSAGADLVEALERLIRETPRQPEPEREQQNPGHH